MGQFRTVGERVASLETSMSSALKLLEGLDTKFDQFALNAIKQEETLEDLVEESLPSRVRKCERTNSIICWAFGIVLTISVAIGGGLCTEYFKNILWSREAKACQIAEPEKSVTIP